ncbi:MAG: hypothetical protein DHS20C05_18350 [Hyphococcus sp.]|nr:MAG: hypothetical protein DHS20C05_18350 [Marinicaulis sp.]
MTVPFRKNLLRLACASAALLNMAGPAFAEVCSLPSRTYEGQAAIDMGENVKGFVAEQMTGLAQDLYAQRVVDQFIKASEASDDVLDSIALEVGGETVKVANNWVHVLKATTIAKGVVQGEPGVIADWAEGEVVEKATGMFMEGIGATSNGFIVGALITSLKTVQESYEALEHEDCLTNIDVAYYNFLEDERLRWETSGKTKAGAVDIYIQEYLAGAGEDARGGSRALNRRYLQCFINETMPVAERIEVSSLGPNADQQPSTVGWFDSVFGTIGDTLASAADAHPEAKRLRTPVNVMLREYNYRYDAELERRKLNDLMRSEAYQQFEAVAQAMKATDATAAWLCGKMQGDGAHPDSVGAWRGAITISQPQTADGVLPDFTLNFDVAEDGAISGKTLEEGAQLTVTGSANGRDIDMRLVMTVDGAAEKAANLHLTGQYSAAGEMTGAMSGEIVDMECVFSQMFADADDPVQSTVCRQLPAAGDWKVKAQ